MDHGADWPETLEYVKMFRRDRPVTIIRPEHEGYESLLDYCKDRRTVPSRRHRWCTSRFKVRPFNRYVSAPCFVHLGIDAGEVHRARYASEGRRENRYILIEENINRSGCEEIIKAHGLPIPPKSGCWFCPFQKISQWKKLRQSYPEMFCQAVRMEQRQNEQRAEIGKEPFYMKGKPLQKLVNEAQTVIPGFEDLAELPPCQCGVYV